MSDKIKVQGQIVDDKKLEGFFTQLKPKRQKLHNLKYWGCKNAIDPKKICMQFFQIFFEHNPFNHVLSLWLSQQKIIYIQPK